jgi:hypothetical protein
VINHDSFKKRDKFYNTKTNLWVDTRRLYIDQLSISISVYTAKEIIKYNFTRNITTSPSIYIGGFTRSISVYRSKFIIKLSAVPVVTVNTTIIYIGVLTKTITVYIPKIIIKFEKQSNTNHMKPLPQIIADPSMIP